jgi:hypothetical protein
MAKSVKIKDDHYRLIGLYLLVVAVAVAWLFCGCATKRSTESSIQMHRMALMTERMDSMLRSTEIWQQSIYMKQQSLVDSFKQSEVRDTSHVVFLSEKGDTIREKIVIREYIEKEHTTDSKESEMWQERFRQTDSLLQVSLAKQEKMDSTLQSYQKETMVEKQPSFLDRLKWVGLGILLAVIAFFAMVSAFMKKR